MIRLSSQNENMSKHLNRAKAQERFVPYSNLIRQVPTMSEGSSSSKDITYAKPVVSMTFDYPPDSKPINKPTLSSNSFPIYTSESVS